MGAISLTLLVTFSDGVTFVVNFATSGEAEFDLGFSLMEVDLQGNQGQRLALGLHDQVFNLMTVD